MTKQHNLLWNPWQNQQRLPLADFIVLAQIQLANIVTVHDKLKQAYALFEQPHPIQSHHCEDGIEFVRVVEKAVYAYDGFLARREALPLVILPLRHKVAAELLQMKEQLWKVLALMGLLRSSRWLNSHEIVTHRYEILQRLTMLLKSSEEIERLSRAMFDQARFQERRLAIAIRNEEIANSDEESEETWSHPSTQEANILWLSNYQSALQSPMNGVGCNRQD